MNSACREHTDAQLRAAWRAYRLPTWPARFEDVMADIVLSRLVHVHAAHMAHRPTRPSVPVVDPMVRRTRYAMPRPGCVDLKRAAAGDRDD